MNTHGNPGFQTEIEFELPRGYVDPSGSVHKRGVMRLATAADEILPLRDPRVGQNEAYLTVIVLSRVILRLGALTDIHTGIIEGLFASDLAYLQRLYDRFNSGDDPEQPSQPPLASSQTLRRITTLGEA